MNKCPFCWSDNLAVLCKKSKGEGGVIRHRAYVQCRTCQARGSTVSSSKLPVTTLKELAIGRWNR